MEKTKNESEKIKISFFFLKVSGLILRFLKKNKTNRVNFFNNFSYFKRTFFWGNKEERTDAKHSFNFNVKKWFNSYGKISQLLKFYI